MLCRAKGDLDIARIRVLAVIVLLVAASACSSAKHTANTATTSSLAPSTSPSVAPAVCGGSSSVAAAVVLSPVAGLNVPPTRYDVVKARVSKLDPTWGRFNTQPKPGVDYQDGYGVVHCQANQWTVTDFGSAQVACIGAVVAPPAVRTELGLECRT